ncbi:hypothetical protein CJF30_00005609 [Rutstroemia sp. NJR-2017a BBW]|nr:hypothetical protein CJF30_00005774 [Rutstroemia sp. NJR-2017a BBW]PQE08739.1 hypothetical protein CJF30_00005609 [Rutstroemia sp. NJR-2017a BBW]
MRSSPQSPSQAASSLQTIREDHLLEESCLDDLQYHHGHQVGRHHIPIMIHHRHTVGLIPLKHPSLKRILELGRHM